MDWLWMILIFVVSFVIGVFAFCNIIGVIRTRYVRAKATVIINIIFWCIILGITCFVAHFWFFKFIVDYYAGTIVSLFMSRNSGKNGPE